MKVKFLSFLFVSAALLFACNENDSDDNRTGELITLTPHSWTQNVAGSPTSFASLRGNWTGGATGELGFFFATSQINTVSLGSGAAQGVEKYVAESTGNNIFNYEVSGLELGVKYYFAAYVKLASGEFKFGEVKEFFVNNLDVVPPGKPTATAVVNSYNSATATIIPGSFGAGPSLGEDAKYLKIHRIGVYLWFDGSESLETAKPRYFEGDLDLIKEGDNVPLNLTSLKSNTKYNFVPFVQIAFSKSDIVEMEAVLGDQGSFTTPVAENLQPEVATVGAMNITQTSATLSGKVTDSADDLAPEVGFYWATTEDALNEHNETDKVTVTTIAGDGAFTCALTGLTDNHTYYFKSYMIWSKGTSDETVVFGQVMNFKTLKVPVVGAAFVRVDATLTDWTGKYLIVYEAQAVGANTYQGKTVLVFNPGSATPVDAAGNIIILTPSGIGTPGIPGTPEDLALITGGKVDRTDTEVTVSGGQIEWREEFADAMVTIAAVEGGGWYIKTSGGYYIGGGNTGTLNANTEFSAPAHVHTISIGTATTAVAGNTADFKFNNCAIIQGGNTFVRVNGGTGRFGYWANTAQHPVALYKMKE